MRGFRMTLRKKSSYHVEYGDKEAFALKHHLAGVYVIAVYDASSGKTHEALRVSTDLATSDVLCLLEMAVRGLLEE